MKKTALICLTGIALVFTMAFAYHQATDGEMYVVTTLAGSGNNNWEDGQGKAASFSSELNHIAADTSGNIYVTDGRNLRKISPDGLVSTIFGDNIFENGKPKDIGQQLPYAPYGVAVNKNNEILLAMMDNTILKIKNEKGWELVAGEAGFRGADDGPANQSSFYDPRGVCLDKAGNLFIADASNGRIRKLSADGKTVSTLAGLEAGDYKPGAGKTARFSSSLLAVAADSKGNVYVGANSSRGSCIAKITPAGVVTTFAGDVDKPGSKDGTGKMAVFGNINAMCCDAKDNIWVAEEKVVRKISPAAVVTTVAGNAFETGDRDGVGAKARFNYLNGICADAKGNIYVADFGNYNIRKISF
jgi:sugar lactone lactonase YvrE